MNKSYPFYIALFFSTLAAAQQTTVDKSTPSIEQTNSNVIMTATALRLEDAVNAVIDSANYHKAVQVGIEPVRSMPVVEVTATATRMNEHIQNGVPKVATGEVDQQGKEIIIKSDCAQPVKPK